MFANVDELNDMVNKKQEEIRLNHEKNIKVFIEEMNKEIIETAQYGSKYVYFNQKWFDDTAKNKLLKEGRKIYDIQEIIRNKINEETKFYSYHNISGLCVTWDEARIDEWKHGKEESKKEKNKEPVKKEGFIKYILNYFK